MRVLSVHNAYRLPGGEDLVVDGDAELLAEAGHVLERHHARNQDGARAVRDLIQSPWNVASARAISVHVERFRPDVAHVHNTWFALSPSVLWALHRADVPTVMTLHNYRLACLNAELRRGGGFCDDCVGRLPWPGVVHRCYRGSVAQSAIAAGANTVHRALDTWQRCVRVFLAPSEFARAQLVRAGLPADRVTVRPNPVPDPGPRPAPPSQSQVVLFAGRLSSAKGADVLLEAWRRRAPRNLRLLFVGEGPLSQRIAECGLSGVEMRSWMPRGRLVEVMRGARALVCPSVTPETFGLAAVEGLAAGLPVLVPEGGALVEAVGDAGPRPVPRAGGPWEWAAALDQLDNDAQVDRWGQAARIRYLDRYSLGVGPLVTAYERALDPDGIVR